MKKLIVCLAILAVVSSAFADNPPKLIGSWENQTNEGWMDHGLNAARTWAAAYIDDPEIYGLRYWFDDTFQSDGDYSLKAWCDPASAENSYGQRMKIDVHSDFFNYSKIEFDIYGQTDSWMQIESLIYSCETAGWTTLASSTFAVGNEQVVHCVYDYSAYKNDTYAKTTDAYGSFIFALNSGSTNSYLWIDAVTLTGVPEPATIGLLGLGGLALLRRKK